MRIAITGGVCDGKTTVLNAIAEQGFPTVSADKVVESMYVDTEFVQKIADEFGEGVIGGGEVRKDLLRRVIMKSDRDRRKLNAITHREALRRILDRSAGPGFSFAEVPLLIEAAAQGYFDRVWVVTAGEAEQYRRLLQRFEGDQVQTANLLTKQLPTDAKVAFADRIVRTNAALHTVFVLVENLLDELG